MVDISVSSAAGWVTMSCFLFDTIRAELDLTRIIESLKSRVSLVDITEGGASSENISKILLGGGPSEATSTRWAW